MDLMPYQQIAKERSSTDPAHDFLHVTRVYKNACAILETVNADREIVLTAVLLHELFNYPKDHPESHKSGDVCAEHAAVVLADHAFPPEKIPVVLDCIRNHSFSKGVVPQHIEGKIVQDADRLDSIGAIGIARCFATGAQMQRPFYEADDPFCSERDPDDKQYGLDHFYTKLLKISDRLHTVRAREMALERVSYMKQFLDRLAQEI